MKTKLDCGWKFVVGGGSVIAYQAFYDRMASRSKSQELLDCLNSINNKLEVLYESINNSSNSTKKADLISRQQELNYKLNNLMDIHNKYLQMHKGLAENSDGSLSMFRAYSDEFTNTFNNVKKLAEDFFFTKKNINDINNISSHSNFITDQIEKFNNYLSNLFLTEICLYINITSSLFILFCLISIMFAVYGNFFIKKLSLEDKYPKLAIFIRLRVKLQHSYTIVNTLLITVALLGMILVNYLTLINF